MLWNIKKIKKLDSAFLCTHIYACLKSDPKFSYLIPTYLYRVQFTFPRKPNLVVWVRMLIFRIMWFTNNIYVLYSFKVLAINFIFLKIGVLQNNFIFRWVELFYSWPVQGNFENLCWGASDVTASCENYCSPQHII